MKYFNTPKGLFALEADGSQDHLIQSDWSKVSEEEKDAILAPKNDKIAVYRAAVSAHIEQTARQFGFDSVLTAVTYADEPTDELNQAYGKGLREWRSRCWEAVREAINTRQNGGEDFSVDDLIKSLPKFEEPNQWEH